MYRGFENNIQENNCFLNAVLQVVKMGLCE